MVDKILNFDEIRERTGMAPGDVLITMAKLTVKLRRLGSDIQIVNDLTAPGGWNYVIKHVEKIDIVELPGGDFLNRRRNG
ncbi:MAG: hypothetical protein US62_C0012G0028 [Candidatus Woesebacteria bacterium GW2011_GWA1_37_8]|uniref:Uncharacterized protein n=2 Tax=Candidatus Woeseibacteriota TaxID=1752722 RepID=A0A0G0L6G6_9BACT|nr:MAG: hypothetical protein US39_C0021G0016 [Microgenomates group bacterium GW2011_GWC1_37_12b]KKQ45614.1 MAG: hypothetical protein US62_C0012G0028 [Candidatus Woesebacteria bacterium GW2011_GWA1_37_8]KKQ86587.1 MAG: hypothetical protein UT10_C0021G0004 [Candidatus Woesebacteria bacterium GW2011_GWB1_38_8b]